MRRTVYLVYILMYLAAIVGHGCGPGIAGVVAKAHLNVAGQVGLASHGCTTAHTKGGGGQVSRHHVLHLAEGTVGGHHGATHVAQDGLAGSGQGGRERSKTTGHGGQGGGEGPGGGGEAAAQHASVGASRAGLSALEDPVTQIANVDVVASLVSVSLQARQKRGHLLYRWIRNNFGKSRNFWEVFRIERPR